MKKTASGTRSRRGPEGRPLNIAQPGRAGLASIMTVERRRRGTPNDAAHQAQCKGTNDSVPGHSPSTHSESQVLTQTLNSVPFKEFAFSAASKAVPLV